VVIFEGVLILPFFSQTILVGYNFAKTEKSKLKKIMISALSQVIQIKGSNIQDLKKKKK
jgi:hypothetical protein